MEGAAPQPEQAGAPILVLLSENWMVAVLRVLAFGTARPAQLEQLIPDAGHAVLSRRLRSLLNRGLVTCERLPGVPPRGEMEAAAPEARYTLTESGEALLELTAKAGDWEATWCPQVEQHEQPGVLAIDMLADPRARKLLLAIADEPRTTEQIEAKTTDLSRSALHRRLRQLVLAGMLHATPAARGRREFDLTPAARSLANVGLAAARWEWQWNEPDAAQALAGLHNLLHVIVPAAIVPATLHGTCRIRVELPGGEHADVDLHAHDGRLQVRRAVAPPDVIGAGPPDAWCDALLTGEPELTIKGNYDILDSMLGALRRALEPKTARMSPSSGSPENI